MNRKINLIILTVMTLLLAACGNAGIEPNQRDSDRLARYAMPGGWTNTVISSGDHYTRVGVAKDSPILAVVARQRTSAPTIQQIQEGTKGKHELQGHTLIEESTREQNGFTVWEAIYEASPRGQDIVLHDVFLFSDALQVEVSLNASQQDHVMLAPDLDVVVESVRANTAEN